MRYKTPSIRDIGLEPYLNSTTYKHNGFDYNAFIRLYRAGVNTANLAKSMNIKDVKAIKKWIAVYKEEQGNDPS